MKLSVIVPAFNEEKLIGLSLKKIQEAAAVFSRLGWSNEIIVCDNNSTDRTAEIAQTAGAVVVFEVVNQISRARNRGAAAATGDWLLFIDADSFPSPELFQEVEAAMQSGKCVGGGATVKMDQRHDISDWMVGVWNLISRMKGWAAGSFVFCEAKAFRELGGFSLELYAAEEIEFSRRLRQLARRDKKKVVILHRHPLVTSARKVHLYSKGEHLRLIGRTLLRRGRNLTDRSACTTWYDGRR